ncbi:MAG TPA: hypothetical protein VF158_04680 [Longimicrobiales bacterium]
MITYRRYDVDFRKGTPGYNITITAILPDGREERLWSGTDPDDPDWQEMGPDDRAAWPQWAYMTDEERGAILRALERAQPRAGKSHCGRFRATIREADVRVAVPVVGCRPGSWRREKIGAISAIGDKEEDRQ